MKNLFVSMALSLCALLASPSLLAQVGNLPGQLFISGAFGMTTVGDDDDLKDDGDTALGFGVGYMFNENLGFEVGYKSLGEYTSDDVADDADVTDTFKFEASGFNFGVIGVLPVQNQIDLYGKMGFLMFEVDVNETYRDSIGTETLSDSFDGTELYFGFGAKYNVSKRWGVGLEWARYNDVKGDADAIFFDANDDRADIKVEYDFKHINVIGATVFVNL